MITIEKMKQFFRYEKVKYKNPVKFPELAEEMIQLRKAGQEARGEFTVLTEIFQKNFQTFRMNRVSQWMNQAQVLRPAFWRYFIEEGQDEGNPSFALRLFNQENKLGVYVELSFIERKKNDNSVCLQNKVLECEQSRRLCAANIGAFIEMNKCRLQKVGFALWFFDVDLAFQAYNG